MGREDPLNLVVEIKGIRGEDAKDKKATTETYWIPAVNNLGEYGRWAFAEFTDVYEIEVEFDGLIRRVAAETGGPDFSALSTKDLLASCPIDEEYLVRPREFARDIDF